MALLACPAVFFPENALGTAALAGSATLFQRAVRASSGSPVSPSRSFDTRALSTKSMNKIRSLPAEPPRQPSSTRQIRRQPNPQVLADCPLARQNTGARSCLRCNVSQVDGRSRSVLAPATCPPTGLCCLGHRCPLLPVISGVDDNLHVVLALVQQVELLDRVVRSQKRSWADHAFQEIDGARFLHEPKRVFHVLP